MKGIEIIEEIEEAIHRLQIQVEEVQVDHPHLGHLQGHDIKFLLLFIWVYYCLFLKFDYYRMAVK